MNIVGVSPCSTLNPYLLYAMYYLCAVIESVNMRHQDYQHKGIPFRSDLVAVTMTKTSLNLTTKKSRYLSNNSGLEIRECPQSSAQFQSQQVMHVMAI